VYRTTPAYDTLTTVAVSSRESETFPATFETRETASATTASRLEPLSTRHHPGATSAGSGADLRKVQTTAAALRTVKPRSTIRSRNVPAQVDSQIRSATNRVASV